MQPSGRRRAITRNIVAVGSVWESRIKMDEVKGGIKVFNGDIAAVKGDNGDIAAVKGDIKVFNRDIAAVKRKRKSWKPPEIPEPDRSPIQLPKSRSDSSFRDGIGEKGAGFVDKEIDQPVEKTENLDQVKRIDPIHEIPTSPEIEKNLLPEILDEKKGPIYQEPHACEVEEVTFESKSGTCYQIQNMVDLVMWRDISRSSLFFGIGSFILLSSSYTKDLSLNFISIISYLGLVYLAAIFVYKSILNRGGDVDFDESYERQMVGEEDAIWVVKLLLPYLNELLIKLGELFSGDPATTMKLAVLLFVMARCGSSITIWTLAKLVFFGLFTIPKLYYSYYDQLARYGKFWTERFVDGWESCTHKKAVAAAVFTVVWNVSSTVARFWAVFMLVVAVIFYRKRRMNEWSCGDPPVAATVVVAEERREVTKAVGQASEPPTLGQKKNSTSPTLKKVSDRLLHLNR